MSDKLTPARMREINDTIRYCMWSVFAVGEPLGDDRDKLADELETFLAEVGQSGVVVRGLYDVAGLYPDADCPRVKRLDEISSWLNGPDGRA